MRKRIRFTLKALLALVGVMAVAFAYFAVPMHKNRTAMHVVVFRHRGGFVPGKPDGPKWLHRFVAQECYINIARLSFSSLEFGDEQLEEVIPHLGEFSGFHALSLRGTSVSDDGVAMLGELPQLDELNLSQTSVSDRSVSSISRLTSLKQLNLIGTRVTSAGVEALQASLPGCEIVH